MEKTWSGKSFDVKLTNVVVQLTMICVSCDDAMIANEVTKH